MPRKKNDSEDEEIKLFEVEPDGLDEALAGLPDQDSAIKVYRVKKLGHPIFVHTYTPSEFSLEAIQQNHGGGTYNLYAHRGREVIKRIRIEIEGEPKDGLTPGDPYLRRVNANGQHVFLNKQEIDERNKMAEAVKAGADPFMLLMLQELKSLRESISANAGGGNKKEFLEELLMYKNLFASNTTVDQSSTIAQILQKGLEIGADAASGNIRGSSWVDTIKELIPVAQQALTAFAQKQAIEQAARAKVIQGQPVYPNVGTKEPLPTNTIGDILPNMSKQVPVSGFAAIAPMLAQYVPLVIGVASRDGDPNSIISLIENNLGDEQVPHVIEWLQSPSWFKDLCTLDQRIQLQAAWWQELHDMLLGELTGTAQDPANANGDGESGDENL